MLASLFNILILTAIVFAGVYIACKGYAYEISTRRMLTASLTFAVLMTLPIPIPIVDLIVPAVGLYVGLMDDKFDRSTVNKVFLFTFLFAVLASVGLAYLLR